MEGQGKNILITGNKGFVGSNLVPYLHNIGFNITGLSRSPQFKYEVGYHELSLSTWNNSFAIIHLAGKAHDLKNVSSDMEYFEVNTELTKTLFNQFIESNCEVFIYMSSIKAVCDEEHGLIDESKVPNPITAYGKSKLASETYLMDQHLPKGKKLYILRPCMIHGAGNKGNLNVLFSMANKGVPYPFGAFENQRSFLSIDNLSFLITAFLVQKPTSGIYNISDDEFLSTTDLYLTMGKVLNKKLLVLRLPKKAVSILGALGDLIPIPINSEKIQKLTENFRVSNQKSKKALNIDKMPMSAKQGIMKTLRAFQKVKNNVK